MADTVKIYDLGDVAHIAATFDPGPPLTWQVVLRDPDGVESTLSGFVAAGAAIVGDTPKLRKSGTYVVRVLGLTGAEGGAEETFRVRPSPIETAIP